jgi:hypothetical protein
MKRAALFVVLVAACNGESVGPDFTFTGAYEDWDSTDQMFMGINAAIVAEVGDPDNTAMTAPNGRSTLTLPGKTSEVTFDADGYLPARFTVDPDGGALGPYEVRGITPARIATYFEDDLGVGAWDDSTVFVQIERRKHPSGDPADVTVTIDGQDGHERDEYTVFPNVGVGGDSVTLEVDAGGLRCHAPSEIFVAAGELAIATVACED